MICFFFWLVRWLCVRVCGVGPWEGAGKLRVLFSCSPVKCSTPSDPNYKTFWLLNVLLHQFQIIRRMHLDIYTMSR